MADLWAEMADAMERSGDDPRMVATMRRLAAEKVSRETRERAKLDAALVGRCGAQTRRGAPCFARALPNGRCRNHGGCSTGPRTPEGRQRIAEAQRKRWGTRLL